VQRQDYIERLIAQIADAIAHILGLAKSGRPEEAEHALTATWSSVLGLRRADVDHLDASTLRALLGEKRLAAASLLDAEADLRRSRGDLPSASRLSALAASLRG
jgi:hypothetical protein